MKLEDYRTWRDVPSDRSELLLDWDTERPTAETVESADGPLARIAAAIHANASQLAPEDCEQVVRWMKQWKRERSPGPLPPERDWVAFDTVLREFRDSPAQRELMRKAARHGMAVDAWTVIAFVVAGVAVVGALAPGIRWYWSVATFFAAVLVYARSQLRGVEAAKAWKEQDRRYLMQSIGAAHTVQELSHAGLFAYLPGSEFGGGNDEDTASAALRRERERLTDALYHDPDHWLSE